MQESASSTGLADMARLAATCHRLRDVATPLLYTQCLVIDVATNTLTSLLSTQDHVLQTVKQYRDPWLSPDPTGIIMEMVISGRLDALQRLLSHVPSHLQKFFLGIRLLVPWRCVSGEHVTTSTDVAAPAFATPLHAAALAGHDHIIQWILERCPTLPVDPEAQLRCICPSLHKHAGVVAHSPTVSVTPLHLALAHNRISTAKLLIQKGAVWDRSFDFSAGVTGLHIMAANGMVNLLNWLARSSNTCSTNSGLHDWPDEYGLYALHYASFALMPGMVTDGGSPVSDADRGDGDVMDLFDRQKEASRLVASLIGIGAIIDTRNEGGAAKRLRQERNRLVVEILAADLGWAYRLRFWESEQDLHFLQPEPAEFAERGGNIYVAKALQAASRSTAV
ncbi:ankyrin unc44 [Colletotrichum sp. SAR11_239]|nr:ankyrin unc44 [Colletotrichum sp. SAR11_239]